MVVLSLVSMAVKSSFLDHMTTGTAPSLVLQVMRWAGWSAGHIKWMDDGMRACVCTFTSFDRSNPESPYLIVHSYSD